MKWVPLNQLEKGPSLNMFIVSFHIEIWMSCYVFDICRTKLKQTEVDCEFLKKCCETLTDENRRLQKELQELKALKLSQPFYMQLPAATLTMCPSCERIGGGGGGDSTNKSPFTMAPKPHFFNNPFTNSSAACWWYIISCEYW